MKSHCLSFVCDSLHFGTVLVFFLSFISFVFRHVSSTCKRSQILSLPAIVCKQGPNYHAKQRVVCMVAFPPLFYTSNFTCLIYGLRQSTIA